MELLMYPFILVILVNVSSCCRWLIGTLFGFEVLTTVFQHTALAINAIISTFAWLAFRIQFSTFTVRHSDLLRCRIVSLLEMRRNCVCVSFPGTVIIYSNLLQLNEFYSIVNTDETSSILNGADATLRILKFIIVLLLVRWSSGSCFILCDLFLACRLKGISVWKCVQNVGWHIGSLLYAIDNNDGDDSAMWMKNFGRLLIEIARSYCQFNLITSLFSVSLNREKKLDGFHHRKLCRIFFGCA